MHQHSQAKIDAKNKIVATARAMIEGEISFIEGARKINGLGYLAGLGEFDGNLIVFTSIDSQTDALPMGKVRELWNPDALNKLLPEIDDAERWARDEAITHCRNLIERFG